jgi:hypothetical protein
MKNGHKITICDPPEKYGHTLVEVRDVTDQRLIENEFGKDVL